VPTFSDGTPYPNINTNALFSGNGTKISAVTLFDSDNSYQLNETAYEEMKPILLGPMFSLSYLAQFLTLSSLFTSVLIWNGPTIWRQAKAAFKQEDCQENDIHNRLMKAYRDVPDWVYLAFLAFCVALFIITTTITHFSLPIWATFLGISLSIVMIIPQGKFLVLCKGIILALTGSFIALNVLAQIMIGFALPGQTVPVMAFKSLVTNTGIQASYLIQDLKVTAQN
jgi:hypothetical protein